MPGVERKRLYLSRRHDREVVLIRLQPGALFPAHSHGAIEECLVLEGTIEVGGVTVREGDFHVAEPGTTHDDLRSPTGALLFVATAHAA